MPSLEPKSLYEPSRELIPEQQDQQYYIKKIDPQSAVLPLPEQVANPSIPPPGLIDLEVGSGIYKGHMFLLSPEQLQTVREICIDAMVANANALREKP